MLLNPVATASSEFADMAAMTLFNIYELRYMQIYHEEAPYAGTHWARRFNYKERPDGGMDISLFDQNDNALCTLGFDEYGCFDGEFKASEEEWMDLIRRG